jgi:uncharacterized ferritin-like protein (DUF455 family)
MNDLRQFALIALCSNDIEQKVAMAHTGHAQDASFSIAANAVLAAHPAAQMPGRPARPALVGQLKVARRSPHTPDGHAALMHSITHIEFNAINLALDAVWRFNQMPEAYYRDWMRVATEEAKHFGLLQAHLQSIGYQYGDFPAHNGLWEMTEKTSGDITARMALVPRTLEARGLDATPLIQAKLRKVGTTHALAACEILNIILHDEVGHVAIGNHWYRWLCARGGLEPVAHYRWLTQHYQAPRLRGPFNFEARRAAGFSDTELDGLR